MVCLGILFGCRNSSALSYILSALAIVGIVIGLRIICYTLYRLLNRRDHHGEPRSEFGVGMRPQEQRRDHHDEPSYEYGVEMQPREREQVQHCRVSLAEGKVVILAGENHASCHFRHRWVPIFMTGFIAQLVKICFIRFVGSDEFARSITWCRFGKNNFTLYMFQDQYSSVVTIYISIQTTSTNKLQNLYVCQPDV